MRGKLTTVSIITLIVLVLFPLQEGADAGFVGMIERITTDPENQYSATIHDDKIVWHDGRHGNNDIYLYYIENGTERRITTDPSSQQNPVIFGDRIVWHDRRNGDIDIYMYDLAKSKEIQITTDSADQSFPDIYGDRIVWRDNRKGNWDIYIAFFEMGFRLLGYLHV